MNKKKVINTEILIIQVFFFEVFFFFEGEEKKDCDRLNVEVIEIFSDDAVGEKDDLVLLLNDVFGFCFFFFFLILFFIKY